MKELGEELKEVEGMANALEDQQDQVTYTPQRSQKLSHQQKTFIGWYVAPGTYVAEAGLVLPQ